MAVQIPSHAVSLMMGRWTPEPMTAGAWLEGAAADVPGTPLPARLEGWHASLPDALREVANRIATAGGGVWLVGGSVREALLGREAHDHDLATTLAPEAVVDLFPRAIPTGIQFGTVTVRVGEDTTLFEVTTLRSEGSYGDGRRPDAVHFGESLSEDLARRDFTINAIAVDLARGLLHDPFGGLEDLEDRHLRAVGEARERLGEDGLRLLRAYRFMDQGAEGLWSPDPALSTALIQHGDMLDKVAMERVWSEFSRILLGARAAEVLERMRSDGMLSRILPGWDADLAPQHLLEPASLEARLALLAVEMPASRWRVLDHDLRALKVSNRVRETVIRLHGLLGHLPKDAAESRRYRLQVGPLDTAHLAIEATLRPAESADATTLLAETPDPRAGDRPLVDGHLLAQRADLVLGRRLGRLKDWLFRLQLDLDLAEAEEVLAMLDVIEWQTGDCEAWPRAVWP